MTAMQPQILKKDGKRFVVLAYEEFLALKEELADLRDSRAIREAARKDKGTKRVPIDEVRAHLRKRRKARKAAA
jgi:PHD/YefM family antitoxin component YafN of YafNO toxin-antitoxin module